MTTTRRSHAFSRDLDPDADWNTPGLLARFLETLPAAVYATDLRGRLRFYNQAAADIWGYSPPLYDDVCLRSWRLYRPDETPIPYDQTPMARCQREACSFDGAELLADRADGTRSSIIVHCRPLRDPKGIVGVVNTLTDITERKRNETLGECRGQVLQLLASGASLALTLEFLIRAMERNCGNAILGSILVLNEAGTHFLRGIGPSLPDAFNAAVEGVAIESQKGICCQAVLSGETVAVNDFCADPKWRSFGEFVAPYGLRAGWSSPIFGSDGKVLGTFANYYERPGNPAPEDLEWVEVVKRTASIAIERKAADLERQRLASIIESSDDAIATVDKNGMVMSWNTSAERLYGYQADEIIGKSVALLAPAQDISQEVIILPRVLEGKTTSHYETVRRRKDGSLIDVSLSVSPIRDEDGAIVGASGIARDITERKKAEQQQTLLLQEMRHRITNLFSLTSGLIKLSARFASTAHEMAIALQERLNALARAHELIRKDAASQGTTLQNLILTLLLPYQLGSSADYQRVVIEGPNVQISASAATNLALVLHELATNSAKYGALSWPQGQVHLQLSLNDGELRFKWRESNGPQVAGPATHRGFGSLLVESVVGGLGGDIAQHWHREGLVVDLVVPVSMISH